jgi:hypothetical protein
MQRLVATHIHDFIGLTLGAANEAARIAAGRGLAAARLAALKSDILAHLGDPQFSIAMWPDDMRYHRGTCAICSPRRTRAPPNSCATTASTGPTEC